MRKICVITGSRAEYGLMSRLMRFIQDDGDFQLQIIATNMHLAVEYGETYKEIEADGFVVDKKIPILSSSDSAHATVKSVGKGIIGFADAYEELQPDSIMVLGDRYEILAAVSAAMFYKIPIVHLHGGEITEGAYDDAIRHAITKMSHLHFTSTAEYRQRVIQMGERPDTVYHVGSLGCDNIRHIPLIEKEELETSLNFALDRNTIFVTFHPVTMETNTAESQFKELLSAIDQIKYLRIIFTMPNSDTDSRIIMNLIKEYVSQNAEKAVWFASLGMRRYLSVLQYIGAVVGNSSSGIIEVPSFHIPTLNIGDRQKGRITAASVVHGKPERADIEEKLTTIIQPGFTESLKNIQNPYEKPNTAKEIIRILKEKELKPNKKFYNLQGWSS
ncbi:MAG: UDP-N-acetylglucosamine 2-epimerase [Tannerella sp.]|jgi:UDP-N-acetylglucosamine 2-epimerase (non-hydrolysing)/GDP/UDP-N,N'-diacetylbacillosamine 2-epimerase (hydrolysing)|nr:UDP-N-acetylglucosamine 2-epimerase [Tannerella sp.]